MHEAIWRVNVSNQDITMEPVPESWQRLGGRGLIPRILLDDVPPRCNPLGPFNKLLFSPGLLVGICSPVVIACQWAEKAR